MDKFLLKQYFSEWNGPENITPEQLLDIIEYIKINNFRFYDLQGRYSIRKNNIPIFSKTAYGTNKNINNIVHVDFFSDIIDQKVGYMGGLPIRYSFKKNEDINLESKTLKDQETINNFLDENDYKDADAQTIKDAAINGVTLRTLYVEDSKIYMRLENPVEWLYLTDNKMQITNAIYVVKHSDVFYQIQIYNSTQIWELSLVAEKFLNQEGDEDIVWKVSFLDPMAHNFQKCPVILFQNNDEELGDCEKILTLLDNYDSRESEIADELQQLRLAYIKILGAKVDAETVRGMQDTGVINLDAEDAAKKIVVEFMEKQLNDDIYEHFFKRTEENIYSLGKSVNMKDVSFSGNVTGIAMKYKMFALECKTILSQLKMEKGLKNMFRVANTYWKTQGKEIDVEKITFTFVRNFPQNLLEESQILANLKGNVSLETAYSIISFIANSKEEIEKYNKEMQETINTLGK